MNQMEIVFITLKPTNMKRYFSIPIVLLMLLTVSCKKDTIKSNRQPCDTCNPTPIVTTQGPLFIHDSNWVKQPDGTFKSDITGLILQAGGTVNKLYSLEILDEGNLYQIYPNSHVQLLGGIFSGSVVKYYDNEICTVTYIFSAQNRYFGELANGGLLPFRSIVFRVLITK
jgi:hypothetical protein